VIDRLSKKALLTHSWVWRVRQRPNGGDHACIHLLGLWYPVSAK
jgi:hypothetical protein